MEDQTHIPVLVDEIIEIFNPQPADTLLDATLGLGGHAAAYLKASHPSGRVVGIDADPKSIQKARANLNEYGDRVTYIETNFTSLKKELKNSLPGGGIVKSNIPSRFSHILFDLGFNSYQMAEAKPGLSFSGLGPADMRYGPSEPLPKSTVPAINYLTDKLGIYPDVPELIQYLRAAELEEILKLYGQERFAKRIALAIKDAMPNSAAALSFVIEQAVPSSYKHGRLHPATRTFQAFRIAVNRELEALALALPQAMDLLAEGGKLAVISFHSLEDRIVKNFIRDSAKLSPVNKKPIVADRQEVVENPRSRSAKLRVAIKL